MNKTMRTAVTLFLLLFSVSIGVRVARAAPVKTATTYVVKKGDRLSVLFGSGYRKVAALNGIKDPNRIRVGQKLALPKGVGARTDGKTTVAASGFVKKSVKGDFRWNPGMDKLSRIPSKGPNALRILIPDLGHAESAILWGQLVGTPENGRFVLEDGRLVAVLDDGTRLDMSDGHMIGAKTAIRYRGDLRLGKSLKETGLTAMKIGDRWVVSPKICRNVSSGRPKPPREIPPSKEEPPLSVIPEENEEILRWELIAGAGTWDNNLAHGDWQYAEGALLVPFGDGFAAGPGFYGMRGSGESETSCYAWNESGFGPQFALRRDYLKEQKDEFGQTVLYPAGWGIKARYIPNDYVSGGNGSYSMTQTGKKLGLYGEVYERTSEDWAHGFTGEYWRYFDGDIRSTWSGDRPQDRGSWNASAFAQYTFDEDWALRGIVGVSHQNWDGLNYLNVTPEVRYRKWLRFGPRFSFALNKPEKFYGDVSRGDLFTVGAFVRVELGDAIRDADRADRQASVEKIGIAKELTGETVTHAETRSASVDEPLDATVP